MKFGNHQAQCIFVRGRLEAQFTVAADQLMDRTLNVGWHRETAIVLERFDDTITGQSRGRGVPQR